MSKINAAAPEPEIDVEWIKFMSRMTRHQNCDTVDADNDSADEGDDSDDADTHNNAAMAMMMTPRTHKNAMESDTPGVKHRKSCISKKTQRRTYTFIDDDDAGTARMAAPGAAPVVTVNDDIRSRFTPIYISTKTKIAYLSQSVNIYDIFWKIPVQHYYTRRECVIKKQIKFQTTDPAAVATIKEKLEQQPRCYEEFII